LVSCGGAHEASIKISLSGGFRFQKSAPLPLLGVQTTCTDDQFQWRNILKLEHLDWLRGHIAQDDVVLPAATYVSMVLDASEVLSGDRSVHLIELKDSYFEHPITIDDSTQGVEMCFWLRKLQSEDFSPGSETINAEFSCAAGKPDSSQTPQRNFRGKLCIQLGPPSPSALPDRYPCEEDLQEVRIDEFYDDLANAGLPYSGAFRGLLTARRKLYYAESVFRKISSTFKVHPAYLDLCFQAMFVAYAAPGDQSMWSPFLPQHIERVSVNPLAWKESSLGSGVVHVTSNITGTTPAKDSQAPTITGDSSAFSQEGAFTEIHVEGLRCAALMPSGPSDDCVLYSQMVWRPSIANGVVLSTDLSLQEEEPGLREFCERLSLYYYHNLRLAVADDHVPSEHQPLFNFITHLLPLVRRGEHPTAKAE
jgi:acyl transferase domain-containing protein